MEQIEEMPQFVIRVWDPTTSLLDYCFRKNIKPKTAPYFRNQKQTVVSFELTQDLAHCSVFAENVRSQALYDLYILFKSITKHSGFSIPKWFLDFQNSIDCNVEVSVWWSE